MISRKIEERNEKIVRGLLKLPPNRRCINCNSLGPQYVCTNFWTFICTTCSGIHREFTHRVKSISMSKFTTEEVDALQNGGNQRARELYLKGWDFQRQRLPDSSNVDRVREFIKNVYVDKKYVSGKISDAPSTDSRSHEEHIRASSYHSYSQSPPYDHQYEEHKYGKKAPVLTRKPGSEKNLYEGKVSTFMYSPTHMSERACNDRFTKEGSNSRSSIHSESGWSDHFRSENMSPSSGSTHDFGYPSAQASMESTSMSSAVLEENARRNVNKIPHPQKTQSLESFGSFGRSSGSYDSCYSNSQGHAVSEIDRSAGEHHNDMWAAPSVEKHFSIENSNTLDLFADPVVPQLVASSTVDFFQLPTTSTSTVNLVQGSTIDTALITSPSQSFNISQDSLDHFVGNSQDLLHVTNLDQSSSDLTMPKNEGWATFDTQPVPRSGFPIVKTPESDNIGAEHSISVSPFSEKTCHEPFQSDGRSHTHAHDVAPGTYPFVPSPWSDTMHHNQAFSGAGTSQSQSWNAFGDPMGHAHWESIPPKDESQIAFSAPSSDINQCMNPVAEEGPRGNLTTSSMSASVLPFSMYQRTSSEYNPDWQSSTANYTNPFDLPLDSASDPNKVFLDLDSLGSALPSDTSHSPFPDEFTEPWFSQHPVTSFQTSTVQASIPYMAEQSQTSQFTDVSPHAPLASVGGNPFA